MAKELAGMAEVPASEPPMLLVDAPLDDMPTLELFLVATAG